jgi:hypothetical protein
VSDAAIIPAGKARKPKLYISMALANISFPGNFDRIKISMVI